MYALRTVFVTQTRADRTSWFVLNWNREDRMHQIFAAHRQARTTLTSRAIGNGKLLFTQSSNLRQGTWQSVAQILTDETSNPIEVQWEPKFNIFQCGNTNAIMRPIPGLALPELLWLELLKPPIRDLSIAHPKMPNEYTGRDPWRLLE